jgi:hypothetical protein
MVVFGGGWVWLGVYDFGSSAWLRRVWGLALVGGWIVRGG